LARAMKKFQWQPFEIYIGYNGKVNFDL